MEDRAMTELHFAQPLWLWATAVLPLFALLLFSAERRRREALDQLLAARLQARLAGSVSVAKRRLSFALMLAGLALAFVALARPQWGFTWEERKQRGRDIIIALDTSRSMLANDLQPNRLTRAKLAAQDLLAELEGDRVGLIAFAGSSFLQAPLTADFGAVRDSLQELDTEIIPRGGTNLAAAIRAAADAFGKGEGDNRAMIIFTDGEELEADSVATARANKDRFHIFTVGLGSEEGSLIPLAGERGGTDFVRDEQGQYVKSRLDEQRLREVAEASGGFYVPLQNGPADMRHIARDGLGKMKEQENDARFTKQPIERYHWPLSVSVAALVAALLLGERKRIRLVSGAAAMLMLLAGAPAGAKNAGIEKFEQGDYAGALGEFEKENERRDLAELHFNSGAAAYELRDYAAAASAFSKALGLAAPGLKSRAAYNLANALARRGVAQEKKEDKLPDLKDAVREYDEVLKADPGNQDAIHNRELVAKLIEELEKEEKKDDQEQQQDKNDGQGGKDQQQKQDSPQGGKDDKQKQDSSQGGKDGQQKQGDQQQQPQDSKQEGKDEQEKQKQGGKDENEKGDSQGADRKPGDEKQGEQPKPEPGEPEKPKSGELKAAGPGGEPSDKESEAAEDAAAAMEGRMTEKDAKQLLEALRKFDQRVRLLDPREEQPAPSRPFRNW
jgi:Ca-activated chloride channel family protein